MDKVDTITVNVDVERKVFASRADMYVEIRGDSLVSGNAALRNAREVRDLVAALAEAGIAETRIQVVGIRTEVSSGIITKSSSAVYRLRIEVPSLDTLADVLGAVTSRKNASLTRLDWRYDGIEELHDEMLGQVLRRAEQRAALICRELNHRNMGVHSLIARLRDDAPQQFHEVSADVKLGMASPGAVLKQELGLDVTHAKTLSLDVRVEYHVQPKPKTEQTGAGDDPA